MKRLTLVAVAAGVMLFSAVSARANLAGLALQYHAKYSAPGPAVPPGDPNQGGTWAIAGPNTFNLGVPTWNSAFSLHVPNVENRTNYKDLYFEIDYAAGTRPAVAPAIDVTGNGAFPPYVVTALPPVAGANDWTYHWTIVTQPLSEDLDLKIPTFYGLQNGVISLEVGTNCPPLPEPASVGVVALLGMIGLRRRR